MAQVTIEVPEGYEVVLRKIQARNATVADSMAADIGHEFSKAIDAYLKKIGKNRNQR